MEIRYDLSKLNTKPIHIDKNHKNNIILYCVETIHNTPYLYFLMIKNANDILQLPYCVAKISRLLFRRGLAFCLDIKFERHASDFFR